MRLVRPCFFSLFQLIVFTLHVEKLSEVFSGIIGCMYLIVIGCNQMSVTVLHFFFSMLDNVTSVISVHCL